MNELSRIAPNCKLGLADLPGITQPRVRRDGECVWHAERLAVRILSLACFPEMMHAQGERVMSALACWAKERR